MLRPGCHELDHKEAGTMGTRQVQDTHRRCLGQGAMRLLPQQTTDQVLTDHTKDQFGTGSAQALLQCAALATRYEPIVCHSGEDSIDCYFNSREDWIWKPADSWNGKWRRKD